MLTKNMRCSSCLKSGFFLLVWLRRNCAPDAAVSGDSLGSEILNSPQPLATNETTITSVVCNVCIFNIFARHTACRKEFKFSAQLATFVLIVASWSTSLDCRIRRLSGVDRNVAQAASSE